MKYKRLLFRGFKTAIATVAAIFLATMFDLQFAASAGIIAILSIGDTKKLTVDIILRRIGSTVLALSIAVVTFMIMGINLPAFGVYLAIYVPLAYILGLQVGLGPCSVLVTHLLSVESYGVPMLINEVGLMVIGSGAAFIINMFRLSYENRINTLIREINKELKELFGVFEDSLCNKKEVKDSHFDKINLTIDQALELCKMEMDNHIFNANEYCYNYLLMRQDQVQTLDKMQELVNLLYHQTDECSFVGVLFRDFEQNVGKITPNDWIVDENQRQIDRFKDKLLEGELENPTSTALLFAILNLFEEILEDKRKFYYRYEDQHDENRIYTI